MITDTAKQIRQRAVTILNGATLVGTNVFDSKSSSLADFPSMMVMAKSQDAILDDKDSCFILESVDLEVSIYVSLTVGYADSIDDAINQSLNVIVADTTLHDIARVSGYTVLRELVDESEAQIMVALLTVNFTNEQSI